MVTSTLPPEEARRLRADFEKKVFRPEQSIPDIMPAETTHVRQKEPSIHGIPVKMIEATLDRVWRDGGPPVQVKDFDEHWKTEKPRVAFLRTNTGDRVLKAENKETGQEGIVNEGIAQLLHAELNLPSMRMGIDGLKRRN